MEVDRILVEKAFLFLQRKGDLHDDLCHWLSVVACVVEVLLKGPASRWVLEGHCAHCVHCMKVWEVVVGVDYVCCGKHAHVLS